MDAWVAYTTPGLDSHRTVGVCVTYNQEVTDADSKLRREAARAATLEESAVASQLASAQAELERVRSAAAEGAAAHAAALQALQALQGEVEVTRREAAEVAGRGAEGLERRYREQTELLYHKQTQLEQLTAAKAADTLRWERELDSARAELKEAARNRNREKLAAAAIPAWDVEGGEVVPTASLVRAPNPLKALNPNPLSPRTCGPGSS